MDKFKPNKSKAFGVAVIQVANEKAGEVIQQLAATHPKLAMTLTYVQASFGVLLAYKQEKLNQFTEYLIEHPDVYTEEKLQTKEFQDGLPVWLDSYFKLRSAEKLKLAQNTFLDFSRTPNMPLYPLERYDDTLEKISHAGLQFLGFIHTEIPKVQQQYVKDRMYQNGGQVVTEVTDHMIKVHGNKPINFFVEEYIKKQTEVKMRGYSGEEPLVEERKLKEQLREPFTTVMSELVQLGLATGNHVTIGWSGDEYFYNLTDYGRKFMSVVKPGDVYKFA